MPIIWKMLDKHAGVAAIAAELTRISAESIKMDRGTARETVERVVRWWYWRFEFPEEFRADS